jgi:carbamoyltransferase
MTTILGLTSFIHDACAALIRDGEVVAACEEERFNRIKHTEQFPVGAIRFCLDRAGIGIDEVDCIAFYMKPTLGFRRRVPFILQQFPRSLFFAGKHHKVWWQMMLLRGYFFRHFGVRPYRIRFMEHVMTHAASAFYPSPFDEAAILSIEGCGEWSTTFFGRGIGTKIERIQEIAYPHSLGFVYGAVTQFLGFKTWSGEGKVMGLAPYGQPRFLDVFRSMVKLESNGQFSLDLSFFEFQHGKLIWYSDRFEEQFGPARIPEGEMTQIHMDLAASVQARLEEVALHMADSLYQKTGLDCLCLAGGVALNSTMNGRLLRDSPFKHIFVQPAANDAGCAIGGPLFLSHNRYGVKHRSIWNGAYFGPEVSEAEMSRALTDQGLPVRKVDDRARQTAELLAAGRLVGWFQGRMEFGPRALGHRSILADPRNPAMKDILNSRVKFRESFRPFAPSVLEEYVSDFFEIDQPTPYMLFITPVRPEKRQLVPAIVHVDGTARAQTVSKQQDSLYWELIDQFRMITGIPVLLNTSFNIRGEPIVNSAEEAVRCFLRTGLDALVLGPFLVTKDDLVGNSANGKSEVAAATLPLPC